MGQPPEPPLNVTRNQNPLAQGAKYGVTGCAGCATFAVLGVVVLIVLLVLAAHH